MNGFSNLRTRLASATFGVSTLLILGGCTSMVETSMEEVSTTQVAATPAVLPVAKPGTEGTENALPTPVAYSSPATATSGTEMTVAVAEPGFDSGQPQGLEELVASRKIIPVAKPAFTPVAFAATEAKIVMPVATPVVTKSGTPIDPLITKYAAIYGIPETLLHRVVKRESRYNPRAFNRGHYGLMQIKYATARSMGYEGPAEGLFDAETNIKYAAKYLRGAWLVADDKDDGAVMLYASGYYYHAKRKGLLEEAGLK